MRLILVQETAVLRVQGLVEVDVAQEVLRAVGAPLEKELPSLEAEIVFADVLQKTLAAVVAPGLVGLSNDQATLGAVERRNGAPGARSR